MKLMVKGLLFLLVLSFFAMVGIPWQMSRAYLVLRLL